MPTWTARNTKELIIRGAIIFHEGHMTYVWRYCHIRVPSVGEIITVVNLIHQAGECVASLQIAWQKLCYTQVHPFLLGLVATTKVNEVGMDTKTSCQL